MCAADDAIDLPMKPCVQTQPKSDQLQQRRLYVKRHDLTYEQAKLPSCALIDAH